MPAGTPGGAPEPAARNPSWLGCGCGLVVALVLFSLVAVTWFAYREGEDFQRGQTPPIATRAPVRS